MQPCSPVKSGCRSGVSGALGELRAGPEAVRRAGVKGGHDRPEVVLAAGSPGLGLEPSRRPVARLQLTPACPGPDSARHEYLPPASTSYHTSSP